mgnify:CR=1 FL=1
MTSFTAEEAWQELPGEKTESVFLAGLPEGAKAADDALMRTFEKLFVVRSAVQGLLETARREKLIGASLEARVVLYAGGELKSFLQQHLADLPAYFIVSQVELVDTAPEGAQPLSLGTAFPSGATLSAKIERARGNKCPRCWAFSEAVGKTAPVCEKCQAALAG